MTILHGGVYILSERNAQIRLVFCVRGDGLETGRDKLRRREPGRPSYRPVVNRAAAIPRVGVCFTYILWMFMTETNLQMTELSLAVALMLKH